MPNTLAHLGLQSVVTKSTFSVADLKWIFLGALIPDVPFMLKRALPLFMPSIDVLDLRLLSIVQASLLFSLILALALALISKNSKRTFLILAFGVVLHLLLDACQTKWGNGPRLLAPIDWRYTNFGFFWPEGWPSHLLTGWGAGYAIYALKQGFGEQSKDLQMPAGKRLVAMTGLAILYTVGPLPMMQSVEASGAGSVKLIRQELRVGQSVTLDRARYRQNERGVLVELYRGEFIELGGVGSLPATQGKISIQGEFTANDVIHATAFHVNSARFREIASIVGIAFVAIYWLLILHKRLRTHE